MDDARTLLQDAKRQPMTQARLVALDKAVRAADAENDDVTAVAAREAVIDTAFYVNDPERTLAAFTWLLARHDKQEQASFLDGWRSESLLWRYKWVLGCLCEFPQISRARIDAVAADLERRFVAAGNLMRGVHTTRCKTAIELGDDAVALTELARMRSVPRDRLADCRACEADLEVEVLQRTGDLAGARAAAAPIFAGTLRCENVPAWTRAQLLLPIFDAGDVEEAVDVHVRGIAEANALGDRSTVIIHNHLSFLAVTGNLVRAMNLARKHWTRAVNPNDPAVPMRFHAALAVVARCLQHKKRKTVRLLVPDGVNVANAGGDVVVDDLYAFARGDALARAAKYDARNGNRATTAAIEKVLARAERPIERPLAKRAG